MSERWIPKKGEFILDFEMGLAVVETAPELSEPKPQRYLIGARQLFGYKEHFVADFRKHCVQFTGDVTEKLNNSLKNQKKR